MQTIQITEEVYRRLSERAARLQLTPEQVIEHMLAAPAINNGDDAMAVPTAGSAEALAAVQRLRALFADAAIPDLDALLADPLIALVNADLDALPR